MNHNTIRGIKPIKERQPFAEIIPREAVRELFLSLREATITSLGRRKTGHVENALFQNTELNCLGHDYGEAVARHAARLLEFVIHADCAPVSGIFAKKFHNADGFTAYVLRVRSDSVIYTKSSNAKLYADPLSN